MCPLRPVELDPDMHEWITRVLRRRRKAAGISLAQMEQATGLDRGNLSRLERGLAKNARDLDGIVRGYAETFGLSPIDLWEEALGEWRAAEQAPKRRRTTASRPRRSS